MPHKHFDDLNRQCFTGERAEKVAEGVEVRLAILAVSLRYLRALEVAIKGPWNRHAGEYPICRSLPFAQWGEHFSALRQHRHHVVPLPLGDFCSQTPLRGATEN
jgi:hypothetical protein